MEKQVSGKQCPSCGYINPIGAVTCGRCAEEVSTLATSDFDQSLLDAQESSTRADTHAGAGKILSTGIGVTLSVIGWTVVLIGMAIALVASFDSGAAGVISGGTVSLSGLLLVAGGQITIASVVTANNTSKMLELQKRPSKARESEE